MTTQQALILALQEATTPTDAFELWPALEQLFPGCSLLLSSNEAQAFKMPARSTFGTAHLLSGFAGDGIFVLNQGVFREMNAPLPARIPVDYCISFDTSAASLLRSVFAGRGQAVHADFRGLLQCFQGNRINWEIEPYLWENADQIKSGRHTQEIFDTALASERLDALDRQYLLDTGKFRFTVPKAKLEADTRQHIRDFTKLSAGDCGRWLRHPWLYLYAGVLKIALLHLAEPKPSGGSRKIEEFLRFMDEELAALSGLLTTLAVERFCGGRRAGILDRLQPGAKDLIRNARNTAWDLFHHQHLYQQASIPSGRADFLIPYFLTFDKDLAALFELYPIKACLVDPARPFPQLFPAVSLQSVLQKVPIDARFASDYLTAEANQRRVSRWQDQLPNLEPLASRLEAELARYDTAPRAT